MTCAHAALGGEDIAQAHLGGEGKPRTEEAEGGATAF